jgi:hypothetical protein
MSDSDQSTLRELREEILAFVHALHHPVLAEGGGQSFDLTETAWRLEVEFGKLLLELWGDGRSAVRRVEQAEPDGDRLRIVARKSRGAEPVMLEIRERDQPEGPRSDAADENQDPEAALRRAHDRYLFERELLALLAREFPGFNLERVSHRSDRAHSFSACYSRGWARRGGEAWAFLGLSELEGPSAAENALAYALIWLDWLRQRSERTLMRGLKLILPPQAVTVAAHRAAYLDARAAQVEILEWASGAPALGQIDLRDYGNVETRLTERRRGSRLLEQFRPLVRDLLGERSDRVQVVPDSSGEALSLRVLGLEVARVEGRMAGRPYFGLEGERRPLDEENRPEFSSFLASVLELRRAGSPDRSHRLYCLQPERWLESLLVDDIARVDTAFLPEYVYPQVPAFSGPASPALSRGVIDILGVTRDRASSASRLAVVELKLDEDLNLPLQGLDYWLRVKWLEDRDQFRQFGYFPGLDPSPALPVLYLVSPAFRFHSTTERILRYFRPDIRVVKVGLNQRWREGAQVLFRRVLEQGRAPDEGIEAALRAGPQNGPP